MVLPPSTRAWEPNAGSQRLELSCPIREVLNEGTRGGGKTDVGLMDFVQHCGPDRRTDEQKASGVRQTAGFGDQWRGILFRRTYPQLADVVAKSKRWFKQFFPEVRWAAGDSYTWTWPTGEQLLFRHFADPDDYWNYHGHEYPWIKWEELTSWVTSECYESMFACNRSSHPGVPRKYRSNTNPYGPGHNWVKRYWIDPAPAGVVISEEREIPAFENGELVRKKVLSKRVRLHSSYLENRKLMVADPEYLAAIEKITDENKRRAWLFGDWNVTSGGMFDDLWNDKVHVLPPFEVPKTWRIDRSFDWGSSKPFSVGWWAESDGTEVVIKGKRRHFPRGTLVRIGEWYGCQKDKPNTGLLMTARSVAKGIIERQQAMGIHERVKPGPADSAIYDVTDERSIASNMAEEKVHWLPADKRAGSRKNGWELMRDRLEAAAAPLELRDKPGIYVVETCRGFIATVPTLPRDEKDLDDVNTEAEDHVADETRYRVLGPRPGAMVINLGTAH